MNIKTLLLITASLLLATLSHAAALTVAPAKIDPNAKINQILVDVPVGSRVTFRSHYQKIAETKNGLFMAYQKYEDRVSREDTSVMVRSTDGGLTWTELYRYTGMNGCATEVDAEGNVFFFSGSVTDGKLHLFIFYAADNYSRDTLVHKIYDFGHGEHKFASVYVPETKLLWYVAQAGEMMLIDMSDPKNPNAEGTIKINGKPVRLGARQLLKEVREAIDRAQYYCAYWTPETSTMHLAYTTLDKSTHVPDRSAPHYRAIYYIRTSDNGMSWTNMKGEPLGFDNIPDAGHTQKDKGVPTKIHKDSADNEFTWLQTMIVKDNRIHFMYRVSAPQAGHVAPIPRSRIGMQYWAYDANTGKLIIDRPIPRGTPMGKTYQVFQMNGFFVTDRKVNGLLYYVGQHAQDIVCVVSTDNGDTWHDFAKATLPETLQGIPLTGFNAISGARDVFSDGLIRGGLTATCPTASEDKSNKYALVYFTISTKADGAK